MIDVIPSIEAHATTSIYSILPNKCTGTINEFLKILRCPKLDCYTIANFGDSSGAQE